MAAVILLSGCRSVPPPKPIEELTVPERTGRVIFHANCSSCHNDRVDRPLHGPSLAGIYKRQYLPSGAPANDERVVHTIEHGRNMMPPISNQLTKEETDELLAYLHTL